MTHPNYSWADHNLGDGKMADEEYFNEESAKLEQRVRQKIRVAEYAAAILRRLLWLHWGKVERPSKWLAPGSEKLPIEHQEVSFDDPEPRDTR